ncbi:PaaX family transcriptional regulator C-terminal domain-containing protein [Gordonia sp. CPCC 205333]|uniref:PaaX family transcriptional regulator C-terminal domain-containing protein n=1 Tax=Gordonia sp. CPCC 205333 TaxID=3140790 RepID=UPI003AF3EDD4
MSSHPLRPVKMTARSAILSALLGTHPAQARAQQIVAIADALGLRESAARVALTRMVSTGDLVRVDGIYTLSPRLLARQQRQDRAMEVPVGRWSGKWRIAIAPDAPPSGVGGAPLPDVFGFMKFAEVRDGVWMRPDNHDALSIDVEGRVSLFSAVPQEPSIELSDRLFEPARWAADTELMLAEYRDAVGVADRFEVAATIVRHILDDPLLPPELLPDDWPGDRLRQVYRDFRTDFIEFVNGVIEASGGTSITH